MFTRCYPAQGMTVLKEYIRQGGREQVILAYLTFESYGYFVGEKQVDPFPLEALEKITEKGLGERHYLPSGPAEKLCGRKQLGFSPERNGGEDPSGMCRPAAEICLFPQSSKELLQFCQMRIRSLSSARRDRGKGNAALLCENSQGRSEEKAEPVKERYQGIYNKEFVLFYGEKLHYYFVIQRKGETVQTQEETLAVEDGKPPEAANTRCSTLC